VVVGDRTTNNEESRTFPASMLTLMPLPLESYSRKFPDEIEKTNRGRGMILRGFLIPP
jgi:hypothetical protein